MMAWTPEIWARGAFDYDGDGSVDALERMRWNDEEWGGRLFVPWKPFDHPSLGAVEIGGWRNDFDAHGITPPEGFEYRSRQILPWLVWLLATLPRVVLVDVEAEPLGAGTWRVSATVRNEGFLDTSVTEHAATLVARRNVETDLPTFVPLVKPVVATLEVDDGEVVGDVEIEVGHLKGWNSGDRRRSEVSRDWPRSARVTWVVRAPAGTTATLTAGTPRAGFASRRIGLGRPVS